MNLKVSCRFTAIFSQLALTLNCYSAMVSSWLHYTKTHSNPVTTEHIRDRSRNPSATQVREGAGTMTSPPFMLKHKNVVYSALPHKWNIIICSELPLQINLLIPMLFKSSLETVCEQTCLKIIKTRQRHLNIPKSPVILTFAKAKIKQWHYQIKRQKSIA